MMINTIKNQKQNIPFSFTLIYNRIPHLIYLPNTILFKSILPPLTWTKPAFSSWKGAVISQVVSLSGFRFTLAPFWSWEDLKYKTDHAVPLGWLPINHRKSSKPLKPAPRSYTIHQAVSSMLAPPPIRPPSPGRLESCWLDSFCLLWVDCVPLRLICWKHNPQIHTWVVFGGRAFGVGYT